MSTNDLQANSDLLFCPFCGGEAHIKEVVSACEKLYTVGCSDSECMGYETWLLKPTVDEAVAAWNRRAERTCRMVRARWDDGECVWGCRCTACGDRFTYETGTTWRYCPACGAKVVEEES